MCGSGFWADRRGREHTGPGAEFAQRQQQDTGKLRGALDETLKEFDCILGSLSAADLRKTYTIQRHEGITALQAIYHVVEHFAKHCGQILYITKLLSETDLGSIGS
ncbi:MAG: DUF1572 family protein [Bryobacteraceae bacterium]